jgi:hypothetical protein
VDLWQRRATVFNGLTLLRQGAAGLMLGTEHPRLAGMVTSYPNLFDVLQVTPRLGRAFFPEDGVKGHDGVAILTYPLWQSLFHGDPNVIGKTVHLADISREVIGVLPADFHFPNANALRAFRSAREQHAGTGYFYPCRDRPQPIQLERRVRQLGRLGVLAT